MKTVTMCAKFCFGPKRLSVANVLAHHNIGLKETDDGIRSLRFNTVILAKIDERDLVLRD